MRVLLIKTSSMGDIIHTLPAITDAGRAIPGIKFDWLVEESFAEIPSWHPLVHRVVPVALRRWRKGIFSHSTREEWKQLRYRLKDSHYDLILDAQGLAKSAFLTFFAQGTRAGLDFRSAREAWASLAYQRRYRVNFYQHAIVRMRQLFSLALHYSLPQTLPDYGLPCERFMQNSAEKSAEKYLVFLHGTTWKTKQWPEIYWQQLAEIAINAGYHIKMSGGNEEEVARALRIAQQNNMVEVVPRLNLSAMATWLANAKAAIAVDTGFGHLAAALNVPTISLYSSTNPEYTGVLGKNAEHLAVKFPCAPCLQRECSYFDSEKNIVTPACFATVTPQAVWNKIINL